MKRLLILLTAFVLGGCATTRFSPPEKALIDISAITNAIKIQTEIDSQSTNTAPSGTPWFNVIEGNVPIIVTAPHATRPFREGNYRFSDGAGTAALAVMLNKLTGVTVIYTTFESPSDPNYYDNNEFKATLLKEIEKIHPVLLLDIHGSHAFRPYDVDLGTMKGKSLLNNDRALKNLIDCLRKETLSNLSCNYFSAAQNQTITKFASGHGVPAIQLEINSTWLVPSQGELQAHRFSQLLQAITRFVEIQEGKHAPEAPRK